MTCSQSGCPREARMAVNTRRPTSDHLYSVVYFDDRDPKVPKKASRYCKSHGVELLAELARVLVEDDA